MGSHVIYNGEVHIGGQIVTVHVGGHSYTPVRQPTRLSRLYKAICNQWIVFLFVYPQTTDSHLCLWMKCWSSLTVFRVLACFQCSFSWVWIFRVNNLICTSEKGFSFPGVSIIHYDEMPSLINILTSSLAEDVECRISLISFHENQTPHGLSFLTFEIKMIIHFINCSQSCISFCLMVG